MKAVFDDSAHSYDAEFTNSNIGKLQRKYVWKYIEKSFPLTGMNVLEFNCGTGEDAVFLAKQGCNVIATDISRQMLMQTQKKALDNQLQEKISTLWLDLNQVELLEGSNRFDLIFSNFGGINCIERHQLEKLLNAAKRLLSKNGRIVLVTMPKHCLWEIVYYSSKLQFKKAFRRHTTKPVTASLGETKLNVWYYNRKNLNTLNKDFKVIHSQPIGFAIPPSYLTSTWLGKNTILNKLDAAERTLNKISFLSNYADHFLIDLKLK